MTQRLTGTGQMLVRSGMEIGRPLQALRKSGAPLSASLRDGEVLFLSCLLRVDGRSIVVAFSEVKQANSEIFAPHGDLQLQPSGHTRIDPGARLEGVRIRQAAGPACTSTSRSKRSPGWRSRTLPWRSARNAVSSDVAKTSSSCCACSSPTSEKADHG